MSIYDFSIKKANGAEVSMKWISAFFQYNAYSL